MGCSSSSQKEVVFEKNTALRPSITAFDPNIRRPSPKHDGISTEQVVLKRVRAHKELYVYTSGWDEEKDGCKTPREKQPKTEEVTALIEGAIDSNYLFCDLTEAIRTELVEIMWKVDVDHGETVISQGDSGDNAYIIQAGLFDVLVDGVEVGMLEEGDLFGETALVFDEPRKQSVVCTTLEGEGGELWAIDRVTFRSIVAKTHSATANEYRESVRSVPLLAECLTEAQLDRCVELVQLLTFSENDRIVTKGEVGEVCYFIKEGSVLCSNIGQCLSELKLEKGAYFGERALLTNEPRAADVTALETTICLAFDRASFNELLGDLRELMDTNMQMRVLDAIPFLQELGKEHKDKIIAAMPLVTFEEGDVIIEQGDTDAASMYIIRCGEVHVQLRVDHEETTPGSETTNGGDAPVLKSLATLRDGTWFGEMALVNDEPRGAMCTALGKVECFVLSRELFQSIEETNHSETLHDTITQRTKMNEVAENSATIHLYEALQLSHLEQSVILGKGSFGTVYLVKSKEDAPIEGNWALKALSKQLVYDTSQSVNVINEKNVLKRSHNPFILKLHRTFQDATTLYMLLEPVMQARLCTQQKAKSGRFKVQHPDI